jgi:predicted nucleic acid-binding protein
MTMKDAHLRAEDIDPLLWDEDEIRNRLILHHLAVCPECYEVAGYILDLYMAGEVTISLGSIDIALGRSRRDAPALWEQLARHSFDRQKALIKDTTRFRSWGLCELLCMKAEHETSHDPGKARELAELAVEISSLIDEDEVAEPHWQHELRGYALAHLANTQRVMSDLGAAEATFALADQWWGPADANMGNVLGYEARYLALKASLRRDQRQMQEALDLLEPEEVPDVSREVGSNLGGRYA